MAHAFLRQDVALDVGTATMRLAAGLHRLVEQPSNSAAGGALNGGVVTDGEAAVRILRPLIAQTKVCGIVRPCVLACAPSDATMAERARLTDAIIRAGAAEVTIIPEPLAAAVGAGVDVSSPYAQMVIDIGEGVTDCAVIRESKLRSTCAVRGGCARFRREITAAGSGFRHISPAAAERLLRNEGTALPAVRLVASGLADTIDRFLRDLPPELGCEIIESGIHLTGGGALVPGMAALIEEKTGIAVTISPSPLKDVVEGARAILPVVAALNRWR